jgi:hypothetical protein
VRRTRTHRSPANAASGACSSGGPAFPDTPPGSIQASGPTAGRDMSSSLLRHCELEGMRRLRHVLPTRIANNAREAVPAKAAQGEIPAPVRIIPLATLAPRRFAVFRGSFRRADIRIGEGSKSGER